MAWLDKTRNKIVLGGAIGLIVAVVTLLVLAIPEWGPLHRAEGGFLMVCWEADGRAAYVDGTEGPTGPCEGAEELAWPQEQIPLTIAPVTDEGQPMDPDSPQVRVLRHAADDLNAQVGFELFRMGTGLQPSDAEVRLGGAFSLGEGSTSPPPGHVAHYRVGGTDTMRGHVWIRSDVTAVDRLLFLVARHEYLHLAGLEHDDFPASLMYDIRRDDSLDEMMSTAHLTDYDRGELQRRYRR